MAISTESVSSEYIHLNSCGVQHLFGKDQGSKRPNGRKDYHILYITEGKCFVTEKGRVREAKEGTVVFFLPGEPQEYVYRGDIKSTAFFLHFSGTCCEEIFGEIKTGDERIFDIGKITELITLFGGLVEEYEYKLHYNKECCRGYLLSLIALIMRNIKLSDKELKNASVASIYEVCRYMKATFKQNLPISEYAQMCSLSESRFSHLFTEVVGVSPIKYILSIKIQKARVLLEETDLSIGEIGEHIGIQDRYYFSRFYKQNVGMTPTEYRKSFFAL